MIDALSDPAVAKEIFEDEEKFIDRTKTRSIRVYEEVTPSVNISKAAKC
jgi:hypothetical protein